MKLHFCTQCDKSFKLVGRFSFNEEFDFIPYEVSETKHLDLLQIVIMN